MMDLGLVVILFILAICLLKWSNVCIYKIEYELFKKRVLKRMRIIKIMTDKFWYEIMLTELPDDILADVIIEYYQKRGIKVLEIEQDDKIIYESGDRYESIN